MLTIVAICRMILAAITVTTGAFVILLGELAPLRSFVLPGGTRVNAELHAARTVCRRAERLLVSVARDEEVPAEAIRYLNRLSDALFVWSRWVNHVLGVPEVLWEPNQASSGKH